MDAGMLKIFHVDSEKGMVFSMVSLNDSMLSIVCLDTRRIRSMNLPFDRDMRL